MTEPTWHVYQLHGDAELLYVGYTRWLKRRLGEHRRGKAWWPEVTQTTSESFATEDEARQREKELWVAHRPKYNKRSPFVTPEEWAAMARERVSVWHRANKDRKREYDRKYQSDPVKRERIRVKANAWSRRNRPTTVDGRRRWSRQSGPDLFD